MTDSSPKKPRRSRGFLRAGGLVQKAVRKAGEERGFAESKLLTHWAEIVGQEIADISRPVKVGFQKGSFGATLVLLTNGANAPILQAQLPRIRELVNACYGYSAISAIRVTQTAPTGFAEGQVEFRPAAPKQERPDPANDPVLRKQAQAYSHGIKDAELHDALERLAANVLSKQQTT